MARSQAPRAVGRRSVSPGPGRPGDRPHVGHRTDAAAGLQPGSDAGRRALALAAGGRTSHHCHASAEDLTRRVADFEAHLTREPFVIADRLWVKDTLDPDEEKLRFSN